jgi:hypothetical protein
MLCINVGARVVWSGWVGLYGRSLGDCVDRGGGDALYHQPPSTELPAGGANAKL